MNTTADLWTKECVTCKKMLPRSAYYTDTRHNYPHCRECERKRLAKYRAKKAEEYAAAGATLKECRACYAQFPVSNMAKSGMCAGLICVPCNKLLKNCKDPHKAVLVNGQCYLCATYGKSDNCTL